MIKKIHMYIAYHTNEERNFIYGYKDKLLSLHKDKDYNGLDVECIEGSPVIDEICRYGKEHHIIQIKERRIDYTEDELERIPYFTLGIKGLNVPDNTLDAGVKYSYKCKSCCSGAVQKNSIELSIKRLLDYDVFFIEPELFISNRVREAFEKADITGCEYLDVIDKRTKKPTKEIFQIKINPVLPNMIRDEYVYTQYVCPECGEPSIQTASPFFYRLSDFEEKYDFYLSKESIFFDCRLHHLASYRIPHIMISKRVKKILEQFSVKQCWYWPVYFEELFNE